LRKDLTRLGIVLVCSLIIGAVTGYVFFCLFIGILLLYFWHIKSLNNLLLWMKQGKRVESPNISGLIEDITIQFFNLRNRHKKRKKKLTNYLKRFKQTTQALPDAILILGENNEIKWANEKAKEYLGINYQEDIDQRVINLLRIPALVDLIKNNQIYDKESEYSIEIVSPINRELQLEVRLINFGFSEKLLMARNISSINKINKMRTDFISNASHELRTPLTVILGYLESFEDEIDIKKYPDANKRILMMKSQAERMNRLIEDLLNLASLETTDELRNIETINVSEMLSSIVDAAVSVSGNSKHEFIVDVDQSLWLHGNKNQLYSAFSNIILNAVNHTAPPGVITVRWYLKDNCGFLEVEDTGEGIYPEYIPRLTERFFRADKSRSSAKGGSGLGLAIVKHILSNHSSTLEIESNLGKGSLFRIKFSDEMVLKEAEAHQGIIN